MRRNIIDYAFKKARPFVEGGVLHTTYLRLLREVVLPAVQSKLGCNVGILYQKEPNFRCHLPGTGHLLVKKHCDADYHHSPNEVNFWLPLTPCYSTNTLWSESSPGVGDFHPFQLVPGQIMQFYGNQCVHYTMPNETDATRMSIDFRVIPLDHYIERYPKSHRRDGQARFAPGAYFGTMDA